MIKESTSEQAEALNLKLKLQLLPQSLAPKCLILLVFFGNIIGTEPSLHPSSEGKGINLVNIHVQSRKQLAPLSERCMWALV